MKIRRIAAVLALAFTAAFGTAAGAVAHGSCSDANQRFCAFDAFNYVTQLTFFVPTSGGGPYSVTDNKTSSVANHHPSLAVCGVEAEGWPDQTVLHVGATQHISQLGAGSNNQIDHFYTC
ncbi:MAG: hypothetical protein QY307_00515 [Acidimicrobiia bacterium]|nr:MAG: hypothetical protein QY307_00515 [Acidimicrobiia bacterium]